MTPSRHSRGGTVTDIAASLDSAIQALRQVPRDPQQLVSLDDKTLVTLTRLAAEESRLAQLHISILAGEIARRSAPELGRDGLAQKSGHRTPEEMVRVTTGTRLIDARAAVRIGAAAGASSPTPLTDAVLDGRLSVAVADAVTTGLGAPGAAVTREQLDAAAAALLDRVAGLDPERAAREARFARDELDVAGIATREQALRERRAFRIGRRAGGGGYAQWDLDPETFAVVSEIYDRVTTPRRRQPEFTAACGESETGTAVDTQTNGIEADDRSIEQYASDVFAELLRQGVSADTYHLLGDAPVGVRIIVAARTLTERRGGGYLEGQADPVSVDTVERVACASGSITVSVDANGQPLNLGRERRLYSRAQRIALAARDGGCRWPGCERPPSWCDAHHIKHWHRDGGRTDIADGILLCRHHHLLAHNNGWEITRAGPAYHLTPPGSRTVRDMPTRSRALRDELRGIA